MTREDARKKLEASRKHMREQSRLHEQAEKKLDHGARKPGKLAGPRHDLEYQKMLKEMKEAADDKEGR
jgi:hypothetical protein